MVRTVVIALTRSFTLTHCIMSVLQREIYGGISMIVALTALISIFALSNVRSRGDPKLCSGHRELMLFIPNWQRTYLWTRVTTFMWPFVIVISAVRAIAMIVELQRGWVKSSFVHLLLLPGRSSCFILHRFILRSPRLYAFSPTQFFIPSKGIRTLHHTLRTLFLIRS